MIVFFSQACVPAASRYPPHRSTTVCPSSVEQNEAPTSAPLLRLFSNAVRAFANRSSQNPCTVVMRASNSDAIGAQIRTRLSSVDSDAKAFVLSRCASRLRQAYQRPDCEAGGEDKGPHQ